MPESEPPLPPADQLDWPAVLYAAVVDAPFDWSSWLDGDGRSLLRTCDDGTVAALLDRATELTADTS